MAYHCKYCNFKWNSWQGNFHKVLEHEKTHVETKQTSIVRETTV